MIVTLPFAHVSMILFPSNVTTETPDLRHFFRASTADWLANFPSNLVPLVSVDFILFLIVTFSFSSSIIFMQNWIIIQYTLRSMANSTKFQRRIQGGFLQFFRGIDYPSSDISSINGESPPLKRSAAVSFLILRRRRLKTVGALKSFTASTRTGRCPMRQKFLFPVRCRTRER